MKSGWLPWAIAAVILSGVVTAFALRPAEQPAQPPPVPAAAEAGADEAPSVPGRRTMVVPKAHEVKVGPGRTNGVTGRHMEQERADEAGQED